MKRLILVCALALAACSGNNASNNGNNQTEDVGPDQATGMDTGDEEDMGTGGGGDTGVTDTGNGDLGSDASDAGDDMADVTEFPDVMQQECFHPSNDPDCPMGEFGAGTFLDFIEIDESQECCRDFTGDGVNDNKIGLYVAALEAAADEDLNANIDSAINAGRLIYLFEYSHWGNEDFDDDLALRVFLGQDTDDMFGDNLAGTGEFLVDPDSFDMDGDPKWVFNDASVNNGHLVARGGQLELFFPGLLDDVQLLMTDVRIEADVIPPADLQSGGTVALENGEISGALDRNLFYDSMNEAALACTCLDKAVFIYDDQTDSYTCDVTEEDEMGCQFDPSAGCRFLSNRMSCTFFQAASSDVDVDTDGDGEADAFSVGTTFTGVGASITGRVQ
jgi:hypothetical protein